MHTKPAAQTVIQSHYLTHNEQLTCLAGTVNVTLEIYGRDVTPESGTNRT